MERKKNLETSLVIVTGLLIIFLFKQWFPLLVIAAIIGLTGIFWDKAASGITWVWFKIAELLGRFIPKLVLTIVYYLFLFPVAMLYRLFRKENSERIRQEGVSMWISREHLYEKEDLTKPW